MEALQVVMDTPERRALPFDAGALGRGYRLCVIDDRMGGVGGSLLHPDTCLLGVSLALLPDGGGQLLVCSPRMPGGVRHALCPLQLRKRNAGCMHVDLRQFKGRCTLVGSKEGVGSNEGGANDTGDRDYEQMEAWKIVNDFVPELLTGSGGDDEFTLKLFPAEAGLKYRFGEKQGTPTGDGERPSACRARRWALADGWCEWVQDTKARRSRRRATSS